MQTQIIHRSLLQRFVYGCSRQLVRTAGWVLFRLRLSGVDRFPESGAALVCSNHQSYLDPLLLGVFCDRRMNYLARENLFDTKFFGALIPSLADWLIAAVVHTFIFQNFLGKLKKKKTE